MATTVRDVMTERVVSVSDATPLKEVARILRTNDVSAVPVIDGAGRVVGVVSEADLIVKEEGDEGDRGGWSKRGRRERRQLGARSARDLMSSPAVTIGPDVPIAEAARTLHRRHLKRLPVVDADGRLVGILSRADLVKLFVRPDSEIRDDVIHEVIEGIMWMDPRSIGVHVDEGVVTIEGEIERRSIIALLVHLVRAVDGVIDVDERLRYRLDDTGFGSYSWSALGLFAPPSVRSGTP